ncbi:hypothetical protein RsS62_25280 [Rhizobium dioscoreae]|uniref:Uncharacterized protein n=1 Tax=Rhizobium dioscoreae TaxID=2653122 RepID=A0ABQ0Z9V1_9HYPH|nr:hypothetical protein RsS62_25280 [Rhizobium dioscoreae]GES52331.1 hypothetical protein RsS93_49450 [Rhizobium dioscoreae]GLU83656.1 hypothetical protein Rhsp01_48320 [Rhizobium sp. NBRC 114257]
MPGFFLWNLFRSAAFKPRVGGRCGYSPVERGFHTGRIVDIHEDRPMRFHSKLPGDLKMLQSSDPFDEIELD